VRTPVFNVSAMTFRNGCLYQDVVSGHMEHLILPMPALEQRMLSVARRAVRGVTRVAFVAPFTTVVALEKVDDADPKAVIEALLRSDIYSKQVIVVDSDVQTADLRNILTAMALNMQATTGVHVFPDEQGTRLDPSCTSPDGRVAKMGIDATRTLAPVRPVTRNAIPRSVLDQVDLAPLLQRP
jgi:2,5-furandicarboxylate decarboxylase 1